MSAGDEDEGAVRRIGLVAVDGTGSGSDSFSVSLTAVDGETTPLLTSESSSDTARDDGEVMQMSKDGPLSWTRVFFIVLSMWALIFLQASNMSGISTIQSTIAADLDAYESAMWLTSSYLISMSSVSPLIGRLAMQFSPQVMILFSSAWFSIGAVVTSQARSFAVFVFGRVLVGIGGGGVMTLSLILVIQLTSKRTRGLMIGLTNAGFTIGLTVGAVVFGALLPLIGWRAIFRTQSPLGLLAGLGLYTSMPHPPSSPSVKEKSALQKLAGVDYAGAVTLTVAIFLFLYSLSTPKVELVPLFLSLLIFPVFLYIESSPRYAPTPILPLSILSHRGILLSCLSQLAFMAARWSLLFYSPVWALAVRGASPAAAGSVLIPTNLGFGSGGLIIGWLHVRRGGSFWLPCIITLAIFGAALFALSFVTAASVSAVAYLAVIFVHGFCTGATLNYTLAHLLHLSDPGTHFIVTGLLSTFRGFAGSFGTSIGGGIFNRTLRGFLVDGFASLEGGLTDAREKLITILVGSPAAVHRAGFLAEAERQVAVAGYETALRTLYRAAAALCVVVLFLQAGTGWSGPVGDEEEEEIEEAMEEHDPLMEA